MAKTENDLDIYYALANANTSRQETEIGEIIKKDLRRQPKRRNTLVVSALSMPT